jgi:hypothetical protein
MTPDELPKLDLAERHGMAGVVVTVVQISTRGTSGSFDG